MAATSRLPTKQQTLSDAYAVPANFLEIDVCEPETHGIGNKRYTDYEVRLKVLHLFLNLILLILQFVSIANAQCQCCFGINLRQH